MSFLYHRSLTEWVNEGQELPRFYGVAYRPFNKYGIVAAPIPINFLVGWAYNIQIRLTYWLRSGPAISDTLDWQQAWLAGYEHAKLMLKK